MFRRLVQFTVIVALITTFILACEKAQQAGSNFETELKTQLEQAGGDFILAPDAIKGDMKAIAASVKTPIEAQPVWNALKSDSEADLVKQMLAAKIGLIVLPTDVGEDVDRSGSVAEAILHSGDLQNLSYVHVDTDKIAVALAPLALRMSEAQYPMVYSYVRAALTGQTLPALPPGFDQKLKNSAVLDLRFTDSEGYNKTLGLIRGVGDSYKAALDKAVKMAQTRYQKRGAGKMNAEPLEMFVKGAIITLNFHHAPATLAVDANQLSRYVSVGLDGLVLHLPAAKPGEQGKTVKISPDKSKIWRESNLNKLMEIACKKYKLDKDAWKQDGVRYEKFRTLDLTERTAGGEVIRLFRGFEWVNPAKLDKKEIMAGFMDGAEWLLSINIPESGMFEYSYYATRDQYAKNQYNLIRHHLATLTLIQAYELTKERRFLDGARRAIEWNLKLVEWEGKIAMFRHPRFDGRYKLGGAGTLLQAMCEYFRFERVPEWEKTMKGLAEFIMVLQEENGHYKSFYVKKGQKPFDREVTIYPGEANLALVRLYHIFKDQRYIDTVQKAFEYYSNWFNKKKSNRSKGDLGPFVPWDMSAMMEFWEVVKKDEVADYAFAMADWIIDNWYVFGHKQTYWKDYVGGFHGSKRKWDMPIWNSGVYGEGVASVYHLAKMRGDEKRMAKYRKAAFLTVRFVRQSQYRQGSVYYLPNPSKAVGCIPDNFHKDECRLDFAYHCLTVNYRLLRFFQPDDWEAVKKIR